jgi:hypothetical protein
MRSREPSELRAGMVLWVPTLYAPWYSPICSQQTQCQQADVLGALCSKLEALAAWADALQVLGSHAHAQ